ncbi:hypothetical protein TSMEX_010737 [Taenia solium]|eukprot:TsM_000543700 transcript=TsM_000543700 gene=TsM_000543700
MPAIGFYRTAVPTARSVTSSKSRDTYMAPHIELALGLCGIQYFTGRTQPTVSEALMQFQIRVKLIVK